MYKRVYGIAWNVSKGLYVRGYEKEDLVQECMMEAFLRLKKFPVIGGEPFWPKNEYIKKVMRNRIYKLIIKAHRNFPEQEYIECVHVPLNSPILIPIPSSDDKARRVVIALLENDMSISDTAKDLAMTYHQVNGHWRRAKNIILSTSKVDSLLRDETIYLAANF